jgi:hypothetical protein
MLAAAAAAAAILIPSFVNEECIIEESNVTFRLTVEQAMCRRLPLRHSSAFVTKTIAFCRAHMWVQ